MRALARTTFALTHARPRWALVCVVTLVPLVSRADSSLDSAREHFRAGMMSAQRGDWTRALSAFSAAYQLVPGPHVLFNLAGAQARCGKLLASNTNYRRLLGSEAAGLSRAQRALVQQQVERVEARIPKLRLTLTGLKSDDRVLLDQARIYPDELTRDLWVDPGQHRLQVFRAQGRTTTESFSLAEGETRVITLALP